MKKIVLLFCFAAALANMYGQTVQTFTSSGSFTVPAGVTSIFVEAWGAGGAGGSAVGDDSPALRAMGGGGGGGAFNSGTIVVAPGDIISYIVAPSTGSNAGTTPLDGGSSTFSSVSADGGKGGVCVDAGAAGAHIGGAGGAGGTGLYNGGKGSSRVGYDGSNPGSWTGAAGGGSAGNAGNGGDASDVNTVNTGGTGGTSGGGNGANGRTSSGGAGAAGVNPGGGGGGGWATSSLVVRNGGAGARGQIRITYTVLPIVLISFQASNFNNTTLLSFATATEHNNSHFSIERSADGSVFQEIGRVTGKGNSNTKQEYTYTDERPLKGINYYRLRQVDLDGTAAYSPVVSVINGRTTGISVAPSPAVDLLKVRFEEAVAEDGRYEIYDMAGRLVLNGAVSAESVEVNMEVAALVPGIYTLRVVNGRDTMTKQFRKE